MTASFGPFESSNGDHECWVPDQVGTLNLMGRTSHRNYGPRPTKNWTLCMLITEVYDILWCSLSGGIYVGSSVLDRTCFTRKISHGDYCLLVNNQNQTHKLCPLIWQISEHKSPYKSLTQRYYETKFTSLNSRFSLFFSFVDHIKKEKSHSKAFCIDMLN